MKITIHEIKGIYVEALTAEIFGVLADIIPETTKDIHFLDAQKRIRAIISREYVEKENQK